MSPNTVATTNTLQSNNDTTPLLSQGHVEGTSQSRLSRLFCKITKKPDDITVARELAEWSRHGTSYLEATIDAALYQHFEDKMDRGLETNLDYRPQPSIPTKILVKSILKVLDHLVIPGMLKESLNAIDTKIWLHETARSGSHGYAARGYVPHDKLLLPLNWSKVRELRDQAVRAAEARTDAIDQAKAEELSESRGYGTNE